MKRKMITAASFLFFFIFCVSVANGYAKKGAAAPRAPDKRAMAAVKQARSYEQNRTRPSTIPAYSDYADLIERHIKAGLKTGSRAQPAYHVVGEGETMLSIAKRFACREAELRKWNGLKRKAELKAGDQLAILGPELAKNFAKASFYGRRFQGRRMSNGERFDMNIPLTAHRTLPLGTQIKVINLLNTREIVLRVKDRGPWTKGKGGYTRDLDLSYAAMRILACEKVNTIKTGIIPVLINVVSSD